ncbi:hypothetical protein PHISCL_02599 [Aspergillus sclerotialis]|uniref:DUF1275 domain protein n=1 Tax=Aspergillus sclerotialis TaxID=2070753 RepID=A0A3A3A096_9EURO|nr:hypothetical protein PHISCL_02599 [Aspergillus sclerotialis]
MTVTGNTIFVGLGASNQNTRPYGWARSLTSIGCFALGCFLFARLNSALGPRQRGTLIITFFLQTVMLIITAALVQSGVIPGIQRRDGSRTETQWSQEVPIVLLSIQSAGQIVCSRALGYNEIPTVVVTSLLCDLVSDPKLFLLQNLKRNRRIIAFILTLGGAIAGGWITKVTGDIYAVLWIAAGIKLIISTAWMFWGDDGQRTEDIPIAACGSSWSKLMD